MNFLIIIIISVFCIFANIQYKKWRQQRCVAKLLSVFTLETQPYLSKMHVEQLFAETIRTFQVEKQQRECYRQVVKAIAQQYEQISDTLSIGERYEQLAHLHALLQLEIDNEFQQRIFATLFMKIRKYSETKYNCD